jgi:transcriptional regulator with XRE-family HTH domain
MTKVSPEYMRAAQGKGWNIISCDEEHILAACPRAGCGLQIKLRAESKIPETVRPRPALAEITVAQFDDARAGLRARREQLCLSIKDVEDAAGLATDHLAKFEKDDFSKIPNAQTFIEWANALGYTVTLRPTGLPPVTLGIISRTRMLLRKRLQSYRHFRQFRADRQRGK